MELRLSLQDHLHRLSVLHPHLCPRQVLGVRMARLACTLLEIDPAIQRKRLFVVMEIGRCAADAVMIVTTVSPTNGLMRLVDYGKVAATFVHLGTQQAVRISERQESRGCAAHMMPSARSAWHAQREAYQIMPYEQLFHWHSVRLTEPLPILPEKKQQAVYCERCGDRINENREIMFAQETLCQPCAFGAYFVPVSASMLVNPVSPPPYSDHPAYSD